MIVTAMTIPKIVNPVVPLMTPSPNENINASNVVANPARTLQKGMSAVPNLLFWLDAPPIKMTRKVKTSIIIGKAGTLWAVVIIA